MKVALLIYGQARLIENIFHNFDYDTYIHLWTTGNTNNEQVPICSDNKKIDKYIHTNYNIKKVILEEGRFFNPDKYINKLSSKISFLGKQLTNEEISGMISQIKSINTVCKLVDAKKYDYFILTRIDCEIIKSIPSLSTLLSDKLYFVNDFLQIFGKNTLAIYTDLMKILRKYPTGSPIMTPELLRSYGLTFKKIQQIELPRDTCYLVRRTKEHILNDMKSMICIDDSNVYVRINYNIYVCKFSPGNHSIKVNVQTPGRYDVSFLIRYVDQFPSNIMSRSGDIEYNKWSSNTSKINVWYNVFIKNVELSSSFTIIELNCESSVKIELTDISFIHP